MATINTDSEWASVWVSGNRVHISNTKNVNIHRDSRRRCRTCVLVGEWILCLKMFFFFFKRSQRSVSMPCIAQIQAGTERREQTVIVWVLCRDSKRCIRGKQTKRNERNVKMKIKTEKQTAAVAVVYASLDTLRVMTRNKTMNRNPIKSMPRFVGVKLLLVVTFPYILHWRCQCWVWIFSSFYAWSLIKWTTFGELLSNTRGKLQIFFCGLLPLCIGWMRRTVRESRFVYNDVNPSDVATFFGVDVMAVVAVDADDGDDEDRWLL